MEPCFSHTESAISFEALGSRIPPYASTYAFPGAYINRQHAYYASCPLKGILIDTGIKGALRREDALKLYELAFFADGDILELGCNHGLSTSVLSRANHDAGLTKTIYTDDLEAKYLQRADAALQGRGIAANVAFHHGDAAAYCVQLVDEGRNFAFAFVDHSHAYDPVFDVCVHLPQLIKPGGLVLFHDYNDKRNLSDAHPEYAVAQAVTGAFSASPPPFEFYGVFGCSALYRRVHS
jgi:predicted O-methyltransferase YrrM